MNSKRPILLLVSLLAIIAATLLVLYVAIPQQPSKPVSEAAAKILLPEARPLNDFVLDDIHGQPFDLAHLKGQWSFLFFGYTHCPDICPTTLTILKGTANRLEEKGDFYQDTRFVFISVDPGRDSLEHLKEYVGYFHPDFLAATGDKAQIDALARQVGAIYMFDGDTTKDDYIVNHSATIVLIDPQGRWIGRFNPPHSATAIAEDYRTLRRDLLNN